MKHTPRRRWTATKLSFTSEQFVPTTATLGPAKLSRNNETAECSVRSASVQLPLIRGMYSTTYVCVCRIKSIKRGKSQVDWCPEWRRRATLRIDLYIYTYVSCAGHVGQASAREFSHTSLGQDPSRSCNSLRT